MDDALKEKLNKLTKLHNDHVIDDDDFKKRKDKLIDEYMAEEQKGSIDQEVFGAAVGVFVQVFPPNLDQFQNRDAEIERMAIMCLENIKLSMLPASDSSQVKYWLFTAAQTWGSGKSWLGNYFLQRLATKTLFIEQINNQYGEEQVALLLKTRYLLIDLRNLLRSQEPLDRWLKFVVLSSLLSIPETASAKSFWAAEKVASWDIWKIISWFTATYKLRFFFHFDEIGRLQQYITPPVTDPLGEVRRYYEFLEAITPVLRGGSFVYCSGRSTLIYALGRSMYHNQGLQSNDVKVACIILDTLGPDHIVASILSAVSKNELKLTTSESYTAITTEKKRKITDNCECNLALCIYARTLGVPRLVGLAVTYLSSIPNVARENIGNLLGDSFREWALRNGHANELNPMETLSAIAKLRYLEFVRLAALQIPLNLEKRLSPESWGLPPSNIYIPLLEVINLFNLYVQKISGIEKHVNTGRLARLYTATQTELADSDGSDYEQETDVDTSGDEVSDKTDLVMVNPPTTWLISFPPVVLDQIAETVQDPRLPFWASIYKTTAAAAFGQGEVLETITRNSIALRIGEKLGIEAQNCNFGDVFPFLATSYFRNEPARLEKTRPIRRFVKFASSEKVTPFCKLDDARKQMKIRVVQRFVNDPQASSVPVCNAQDWKEPYLQTLIAREVLLCPGPMSHSADLLYLSQSEASLQLQMKDGKQIINSTMLVEEGPKVEKAHDRCTTFVVIGFNVDHSLELRSDAERVGDTAIRFTHPSSFLNSTTQAVWQVPQGMDVVILLDSGVDFLLTQQNADLLRTRTQDIEAFAKPLFQVEPLLVEDKDAMDNK